MYHLVRAMLRDVGGKLREAGYEARVAHELRRHDVIGMPAGRCGRDDDAWLESTNHARQPLPSWRIVHDARVRQVEILACCQAHDFGGAARLLRPRCGRAAGAHFTLREIDDGGAIALSRRLDQCPATSQLDVV